MRRRAQPDLLHRSRRSGLGLRRMSWCRSVQRSAAEKHVPWCVRVAALRCAVTVRATLRLCRAWLMRLCALAFSAIFCFCVCEYLREETVAANEAAQKTSANRDTTMAFAARRNPVIDKPARIMKTALLDSRRRNCRLRLKITVQPRSPRAQYKRKTRAPLSNTN